MTRVLRVSAVAVILLGSAASAVAAPILELEPNNTIAGAQVIPSSAFTTPVPATVFNPPGYPTATVAGLGGANDVDFFAFTAAGGNAYFDIDDDPFTIDSILALFDSAGTLLAYGDDSDPKDPGSADGRDSFLGVFALPGPGIYYLAVSTFANFPNAAVTASNASALTRPDLVLDGGFAVSATRGDSSYLLAPTGNGTLPYTLHLSVQNPTSSTTPPTTPVPEPGTLVLLGAGLTAMAARARRRR